MSIFDGKLCQPGARPAFGDVIAVHRFEGAYDHYGVYKDDACVYEYAGSEGDSGDICVRISPLKKFIGTSGGCFVVSFPEKYEEFAAFKNSLAVYREPVDDSPFLASVLQAFEDAVESCRASAYHLYTPEETIQRAHSRLGERNYSLPFNNCEHFAIWCKTGLSDSRQVDAALALLQPFALEAAARLSDPLFWYHVEDAVSFLGESIADFGETAAEKIRSLFS